MIATLKSTLFTLALAAALPVLAHEGAAPGAPEMTPEQKAMMEAYQKAATPGEVHARLAKTAGTYDFSLKSWEAPGQEPTIEKGVSVRKMTLGGRVMIDDTESSMHGQPFTGHGMHGYDNVTGKHWSTWIDSMGTGIMLSEGSCDAKDVCTFNGSWNDPVSKAKINARMTSRWTNATTEVFEMYTPGPDGKEMKMMEITYTKRAN